MIIVEVSLNDFGNVANEVIGKGHCGDDIIPGGE